jgi:hypothetical protein
MDPVSPRPPRTGGPSLEADEYAPLDMRPGWHQLSILLLLGALGSRYLVRLFPLQGLPFWYRIMVPGLASLVLAMLGLLFGLLGRRAERGARLARWGVWLNAVVIVLSLLLAAAFFWILPGDPGPTSLPPRGP